MAESEAPTAFRKHPAPHGANPSSAAAKKRARYQFANINDYEKLEELGEGAYNVVCTTGKGLFTHGKSFAVSRPRQNAHGKV
ncbi:unnamed protein product [Urochloa humidicola]